MAQKPEMYMIYRKNNQFADQPIRIYAIAPAEGIDVILPVLEEEHPTLEFEVTLVLSNESPKMAKGATT